VLFNMLAAPLFFLNRHINALFRAWAIIILLVLAYVIVKEWYKRRH
jgi:hypothetical protein